MKNAMIKIGLLVVCYTTCSVIAANLPSYITACAIKDPNFDECVIKNAKAAIPTIVKGDKKYAVPNLSPLVLPLVDLQAGDNFNLKFKNMHVEGLQNMEIDTLKINLDKHDGFIKFKPSSLQLKGPYVIKGKILVLPIEGEGDAVISFTDTSIECKPYWEIIKNKDGEEYAEVKGAKGGYNTKLVHYEFGNLFNGDKQLGPELNKVMNENWEVVNEDLKAPLAEIINQVCKTIISGYFDHVPYKKLFI